MRLNWAMGLRGVGVCGLIVAGAWARDSKPLVPAYVLRAHTVAVMVDPEAGLMLEDPGANQRAQRDVETAMLNWGRFTPVLGAQQADLVIVLRKGHGRLVEETVTDPRQNNRAGVINPSTDGVSIGAQRGAQPPLSSTPGGTMPDASQGGSGGGRTQTEVGDTDDRFEVYEGDRAHPLDGNAGWRWVRKDGLHSHDVPAVGEFRKAIAEAEKQAAKQAGKHP